MDIIDRFLKKHEKPSNPEFNLLKPQTELHLSDQPYAINKEAIIGESELIRLARSDKTDCEGAWLYSKDLNRWYNVGHSPSRIKDSEKEIVFGVYQRNLDLKQMGKRLVNYHIHPAAAENEFIEININAARKEGGKELSGIPPQSPSIHRSHNNQHTFRRRC